MSWYFHFQLFKLQSKHSAAKKNYCFTAHRKGEGRGLSRYVLCILDHIVLSLLMWDTTIKGGWKLISWDFGFPISLSLSYPSTAIFSSIMSCSTRAFIFITLLLQSEWYSHGRTASEFSIIVTVFANVGQGWLWWFDAHGYSKRSRCSVSLCGDR